MTSFDSRRDRLRHLLKEKSLDALLVTEERNVTYLTGFTGDSSYLIVGQSPTGKRELLLTDHRYTEQLESECPGLELAVRGPGVKQADFTVDTLTKLKLPSLGVEADTMSVGMFEKLHEKLSATKLARTENLVESLREIKDEGEIGEIREAIRIAEQAFAVIRNSLRHGRSEKEVADELEYQIRLFGGTCGAFPSIVGVGPRAALPHGRPVRESKIGDHGFVLIDWGARGRLYHSDLTRVLTTAKLLPRQKIEPKLQEVYGVVLAAQRAAIDAIRPGAIMKNVDAAARNVIDRGGFGKNFGHSLGHGIGLAVHEQPRLAPDQDRQLAAGMVVTVEPGIYLPGWGGVRIEDDVLVTEDGCEVLTSVPKELEACAV
ncbi:MAG: Xaa-Pro peptidase family protein [Planctomycetaceae bacterium]|nr:Xaa-Pro peptidase family protein [Planctomycetaceae bacterium]